MSRRVLVLGSSGFLGSSVCRVIDTHPARGTAVRHVHHVDLRVVDPAVPGRGHPTWLDPANGHEPVVPLDLGRCSVRDVLTMITRVGPQVIVNAVGATSGDDLELCLANVVVVAKVLEALAEQPEIHFIQLGSAAEYGITEEGRPVSELDPVRPVNAYGRTKLAATELVLEAAAEGKARATVLRVFNPIGPGAPAQTMLGRAARRIEEAKRAGVGRIHLGSLSSHRDYIDVRDVAWAIVAAGVTPSAAGEVFNVGRGDAVQSRSLVRELAEVAGFHGEIDEDDAGSDRSARVGWQAADITAIRRRLPWAPRFPLSESVRDVWAREEEVVCRI